MERATDFGFHISGSLRRIKRHTVQRSLRPDQCGSVSKMIPQREKWVRHFNSCLGSRSASEARKTTNTTQRLRNEERILSLVRAQIDGRRPRSSNGGEGICCRKQLDFPHKQTHPTRDHAKISSPRSILIEVIEVQNTLVSSRDNPHSICIY